MSVLPANSRNQDTARASPGRLPGVAVIGLWVLCGASILLDGVLASIYQEPVMVVMRGISLMLVGATASATAIWGHQRDRTPEPDNREQWMKFLLEVGWQARHEEDDIAEQPTNVIQMRRPEPPVPLPPEWPAWIPQRGKHGA